MSSEALTGIILVLLALVMMFYKQITGRQPVFSSSPGSEQGNGGGSQSPAGSENTGGWLDLDYSNVQQGSLSNAPAAVQQWYGVAKRFADDWGLPWEIVLAQIWQESTGNPGAVGANSDYGLLQVTPIAVQDLKDNGYTVPDDWKFNPYSNVETGVKYLHLQYNNTGVLADALGQTKADSLEAYNEGFTGASRDYGPDEYSVEVIEKALKIGFSA